MDALRVGELVKVAVQVVAIAAVVGVVVLIVEGAMDIVLNHVEEPVILYVKDHAFFSHPIVVPKLAMERAGLHVQEPVQVFVMRQSNIEFNNIMTL